MDGHPCEDGIVDMRHKSHSSMVSVIEEIKRDGFPLELCSTLILVGNNLQNLHGVEELESLKLLDLRFNLLSNLRCILPISQLMDMRRSRGSRGGMTLRLEGNPLVERPEFSQFAEIHLISKGVELELFEPWGKTIDGAAVESFSTPKRPGSELRANCGGGELESIKSMHSAASPSTPRALHKTIRLVKQRKQKVWQMGVGHISTTPEPKYGRDADPAVHRTPSAITRELRDSPTDRYAQSPFDPCPPSRLRAARPPPQPSSTSSSPIGTPYSRSRVDLSPSSVAPPPTTSVPDRRQPSGAVTSSRSKTTQRRSVGAFMRASLGPKDNWPKPAIGSNPLSDARRGRGSLSRQSLRKEANELHTPSWGGGASLIDRGESRNEHSKASHRLATPHTSEHSSFKNVSNNPGSATRLAFISTPPRNTSTPCTLPDSDMDVTPVADLHQRHWGSETISVEAKKETFIPLDDDERSNCGGEIPKSEKLLLRPLNYSVMQAALGFGAHDTYGYADDEMAMECPSKYFIAKSGRITVRNATNGSDTQHECLSLAMNSAGEDEDQDRFHMKPTFHLTAKSSGDDFSEESCRQSPTADARVGAVLLISRLMPSTARPLRWSFERLRKDGCVRTIIQTSTQQSKVDPMQVVPNIRLEDVRLQQRPFMKQNERLRDDEEPGNDKEQPGKRDAYCPTLDLGTINVKANKQHLVDQRREIAVGKKINSSNVDATLLSCSLAEKPPQIWSSSSSCSTKEVVMTSSTSVGLTMTASTSAGCYSIGDEVALEQLKREKWEGTASGKDEHPNTELTERHTLGNDGKAKFGGDADCNAHYLIDEDAACSGGRSGAGSICDESEKNSKTIQKDEITWNQAGSDDLITAAISSRLIRDTTPATVSREGECSDAECEGGGCYGMKDDPKNLDKTDDCEDESCYCDLQESVGCDEGGGCEVDECGGREVDKSGGCEVDESGGFEVDESDDGEVTNRSSHMPIVSDANNKISGDGWADGNGATVMAREHRDTTNMSTIIKNGVEESEAEDAKETSDNWHSRGSHPDPSAPEQSVQVAPHRPLTSSTWYCGLGDSDELLADELVCEEDGPRGRGAKPADGKTEGDSQEIGQISGCEKEESVDENTAMMEELESALCELESSQIANGVLAREYSKARVRLQVVEAALQDSLKMVDRLQLGLSSQVVAVDSLNKLKQMVTPPITFQHSDDDEDAGVEEKNEGKDGEDGRADSNADEKHGSVMVGDRSSNGGRSSAENVTDEQTQCRKHSLVIGSPNAEEGGVCRGKGETGFTESKVEQNDEEGPLESDVKQDQIGVDVQDVVQGEGGEVKAECNTTIEAGGDGEGEAAGVVGDYGDACLENVNEELPRHGQEEVNSSSVSERLIVRRNEKAHEIEMIKETKEMWRLIMPLVTNAFGSSSTFVERDRLFLVLMKSV
eukprot:GHVN01067302.1.p1 GENE.GHVN01067302.1~~GHVN01067302.1.p1  ORF type:complete len:1428 (-),score=264.19 GHVN01067302.1:1268-5551(-)